MHYLKIILQLVSVLMVPTLVENSLIFSLVTFILVVHSRDVEDCGGASRRKFTLKPTKIPYIMIWQHWLGNTKPKKAKKAFRLILNAFKKLLQNLNNRIFY